VHTLLKKPPQSFLRAFFISCDAEKIFSKKEKKKRDNKGNV
jgi:hypothetical protein